MKDSSDGYHFEPHVAEQVFERLLSNAVSVRVLRRHQFDGQAQVENQKLKSITITNRGSGERFKSKPRRSLMPPTKGTWQVLQEFLTGLAVKDETRLWSRMRAYYSYFGTKEIYDDPRTGQGDHRIQAYNYRLCLTDRPDLRVLPSKPSTYRRDDYASLAEDIQKQWVTAFGATPWNTSGIVNIVRIPNGKSDTNNHHNSLVSTDLPEENQPWPEAKWEWRDQFEKRLTDYTLGLLWFAQNDDSLPQWFREQSRQWGLARDEYQDNGHFPRQVYVREGRRIRGEYDFSALDAMVNPGAARTPVHPGSITAAHYAIDSHALRKREPGKRALDGFLGLGHITRPYTVPYGVMVPQKVDGLLVPVAVSATHLGFGTLRMEPCWMAWARRQAQQLIWRRNLARRYDRFPPQSYNATCSTKAKSWFTIATCLLISRVLRPCSILGCVAFSHCGKQSLRRRCFEVRRSRGLKSWG